MTEQEAIKNLKEENEQCYEQCDGSCVNAIDGKCACRDVIIASALEEIQQYRAIGTPKEVKQKLEELERWHTYRLAINVKNPFAKMSTSICHNCDHKDEYIEELEAEVEEYRKIGTAEECREAVEKQKAKKPKEYEDKFYGCPTCGNVLLHKWEKYPTKLMDKKNGLLYCLGCGQKIDWSEEDEHYRTKT